MTILRPSFCFFSLSSSLKASDNLLERTFMLCCSCSFCTIGTLTIGSVRYMRKQNRSSHIAVNTKHLVNFPKKLTTYENQLKFTWAAIRNFGSMQEMGLIGEIKFLKTVLLEDSNLGPRGVRFVISSFAYL